MLSQPPIQIGKIGKMGIAKACFSPLSLSPALWLDATDLSTITESGGAVSQWDDKSGNGNHATQGTGSQQPTTGTRTINGKNVLDFNGISNWLDIPDDTFDYGPVTVIAAFETDVATNDIMIIGSDNSTGSNRFYLRTFSIAFGNSFKNTTPLSGTPTIQVGQVFGTGTTTQRMIIGDGSYDNISVTTRDVASAKLTIGAYNEGLSSFFNGKLAEIIGFNRVLTDVKINKIGNHFAAKWGAPWTNI